MAIRFATFELALDVAFAVALIRIPQRGLEQEEGDQHDYSQGPEPCIARRHRANRFTNRGGKRAGI